LKRICVFCGSSEGRDPRYRDAARDLGRRLVSSGHALVYGGGAVGLMGILAGAVLQGGGEAIGVIPEILASREVVHTGVKDLRVVTSMHARKALMYELADAFIILPGGLGTLDELFEVMTWTQLGLHSKPIGLLNVASYFSPLLEMIDRAVEGGFIPQESRAFLTVSEDPAEILRLLARHP
jgi:uncharacterized protein (TIGR00730 family)